MDLAAFFRERAAGGHPPAPHAARPQPRAGPCATARRRLCRFAADLAVDTIYQRIVAHQPVLDDAARVQVRLVDKPAVVLMETSLLPAAFKETWRQGEVSETGLNWAEPPMYEMVELPEKPLTLQTAPTVVVAGQGLGDEAGFAPPRRNLPRRWGASWRAT